MKKAIKFIDIHGHINFSDYDADREDVIARAAEVGVGMIVIGTNIESSKKAIEIAETHENIWATVGIHPEDIAESDKLQVTSVNNEDLQLETCNLKLERSDFEELRRLALHPKVVAIGECGLDYFQSDETDIPAQIETFERHIAIANEVKKPLMLHVRNGKKKGDSSLTSIKTGRNAYKDALDILKKSAKVPFDFHFFAGSIDDMNNIIKVGGAVSFTGVLTFTHDYDELIKAAPIQSLMSETDCPYVAPVPYRGRRCEPVHVIEVVKAIARIRGEDEEKIRIALLENAQNLFNTR